MYVGACVASLMFSLRLLVGEMWWLYAFFFMMGLKLASCCSSTLSSTRGLVPGFIGEVCGCCF